MTEYRRFTYILQYDNNEHSIYTTVDAENRSDAWQKAIDFSDGYLKGDLRAIKFVKSEAI